ncbi:MAG: glycosyltransferase [Acidobacteriota bacterium]
MPVNENIRVTYLITTRNRGMFLERTLDNVREFIEPEDELIIIDGASTDGTAEIVARSRDVVTTFISEQDSGEGHAFNKGLFRARGRYIKPITDDDYFYPDAMRRAIAEMEANPDVDAIQCGGEMWSIENGRPIFRGFRSLSADVAASAQSVFDVHCGLGIILRRTALEKTGGVSNNYVSVDGDLTCRLVECACVVRYLDVNLYRWYLHSHSGCVNRQKELESGYLLFEIRLGRWQSVVRRDPRVLAAILLGEGDWNKRGLCEWAWIAGAMSRSPLRGMSPFVVWLLGFGAATKRKLKGLAPQESQQGQSDSSEALDGRQWTGRLA